MAYQGAMDSYKNTEPNKIMVTDRILLTDPMKIVAYSVLGTDVGKFAMVNRDGKEYRWLEDTYLPETVTVHTDQWSSVTTNTNLTVSVTTILQPGDILERNDELIWVISIDANGVASCERNYAGTTSVTHTTATTLNIIGRARIDGDEADDSGMTEVTSSTNYTQIFQKSVEVARTKQKMAQYGISDPMGREIDKAMDELMILLNKLPYFGGRNTGSATAGRAAGGFRTFITDNSTDVASAALTRDHIDDLLQAIFDDGGDPDLILCGAFAQRKINSFYEGFITTERSEALGGNMITKLMNPISGRNLDVFVDRACPTDELWVLSSDKIAFYPFDPFFYEDLAKVGDAEVGEVVGEYGFICAADKHHGFLYGISTSS